MESLPPLRTTTDPIRLLGLLLSILVLAVQLGDIKLPASVDIVRLCGRAVHGGLHNRKHHDGDGTVLVATAVQTEAGAVPLVLGSASAGRLPRSSSMPALAPQGDRPGEHGSRAWQPARGPPLTA